MRIWRPRTPEGWKTTRLLIVLVVMLAFGLFVWPTPWEYSRIDKAVYRVNRGTGETQVKHPLSLSSGWQTYGE